VAGNSITPIAAVNRVRGAKIGERYPTYFTQLEEWRIYSQLLAEERRQQEQAVISNPTGPTCAR
jgi:hypothetical protein